MLSWMRLHHLIMFLLIIALYFYANILLFHSDCCRKHFVSLALNNLWPPETVLQSCCPLLHDVNKSSVLRFPSVLLYVRPYHISLVKRYHKSIKHERCFGRDDNFHHVVFNILCIIFIIYFSCIPSTVLNLTQWMCFIKQ